MTPQVMFIHLKTPFGPFHTLKFLLDQKIEKHRKILGLVKFSTFEKIKFFPGLVGLAHLYQTTWEVV